MASFVTGAMRIVPHLDIIYYVTAVKGLSVRFRNGYVGRGNPEVVKDFRLILNYELDLL